MTVEPPKDANVLLPEYTTRAAKTDRFPKTDLSPILLGLFGEVGGIMAAVKKHRREGHVFTSYRLDVEEDFGDALWYFNALCTRLDVPLAALFGSSMPDGSPDALNTLPKSLDAILLELGEAAGHLLNVDGVGEQILAALQRFAACYLSAIDAAKISFPQVIKSNLIKIEGRFLDPDPSTLPTFDSGYPEDECLPDSFEIVIRERRSGQSCLQWNGVFIGDPLTDNIADRDGYRFHDVFHFAHAAVLHWSPTFRALIKHKRKSTPEVDEAQDGGRAIVVEEGLSAWVFSRAKLLDFFEGQTSVSFDLLKGIQQFVSGYEVEQCPLKLWEDAILQGYDVFRQVKRENGGIVIGDRKARRITYKSLRGNS